MNPHPGRWFNTTSRSYSGCWTCRIRRKKCDEKHPVCDVCSSLHITCHYEQEKPEWMDGGARQEEMTERIKRQVKEEAYRRPRGGAVAPAFSGDFSTAAVTNGERAEQLLGLHGGVAFPGVCSYAAEPSPSTSDPQCKEKCGVIDQRASSKSAAYERSDSILLMFYLEHLFPFLFPFYSPPLLQGGKAWILDMMMTSPVIRQAILCQSSYFFSLAQRVASRDVVWETIVTQSGHAFGMLRKALQLVASSSVEEHVHGVVRIMSSVMQLQRFEVAISSFDNCQSHLNAALALFVQLLNSSGAEEPAGPGLKFRVVMDRIGLPEQQGLSAQNNNNNNMQVPSAEQAAFRFSSALLILDDIIASTVLQEEPRLYGYYHSLLRTLDDADDPLIDLEAVMGCRNWPLMQIGEIAALDAWKQKCKRDGSLDVMELVRRATAIKNALEDYLPWLETSIAAEPKEKSSLVDVLMADSCRKSNESAAAGQNGLVTRVWTHAALLYLFVVVSGWQPFSADVRYHVGRIVELLALQISPPALLRTMVWPFCVAGCLAEPAQEAQLRGLAEALQPPCVFGTVKKALEFMENVWRDRDSVNAANRDLAMCFRVQGELVLLV